jgi:hypothetical protein
MPGVWRTSLQKLRPRFEAEAAKGPDLRCVATQISTFIPSHGPDRKRTGELRHYENVDVDTLLDRARTFHLAGRDWVGGSSWWVVRRGDTATKAVAADVTKPEIVMAVRYCGGDDATALRFDELAADAGFVLATMPAEARQVLPERFHGLRFFAEESTWLTALWCLAWQLRPGSLLRAMMYKGHGDPEGMYYSAMPIDPFAASVELIDLLLGQRPAEPLATAERATDHGVSNKTVQAVLTILRERRGKGMSGKEIVAAVKKKHIAITESYFRRHIVPKLKENGVQNHRSRGGYFIAPT